MMENAGFALAAYSIVWLAVFGYVLVLVRRQSNLRREISKLKEMIEAGHGKE